MLGAKSYILVDADSGQVLAEHNADERLPPASLTKVMTTYVVFHELANGHLTLETPVTVSEKAWRTPGSRSFIDLHAKIPVQDLLKGVIVQSGNDASVALAEHVAGDESTFAELMNQHAKRLGLENSHFKNSDGLPHPEHYTTARDLARLTRALIQSFPEYYKWHALKEFTLNGITQQNRNRLLWLDESVDGVKTGHTEEAGYCLVASALRENMRLISVVMGTDSVRARSRDTQALLNYGFRFFETHPIAKAGEPLLQTKVWKGDIPELPLGMKSDLFVTVARNRFKEVQTSTEVTQKIIAPVEDGEPLGTLRVTLGDQTLVDQPLVALRPVAKGSLFSRLVDEARLLFK